MSCCHAVQPAQPSRCFTYSDRLAVPGSYEQLGNALALHGQCFVQSQSVAVHFASRNASERVRNGKANDLRS